jgi:hypothetical protein
MAKLLNPIDGMFPDIDRILKFMIVKNQVEADRYETDVSRRESAIYVSALLQQDSFFMYHPYYTPAMFQQVCPNVPIKDIMYWLDGKNIYNVPEMYREELRQMGRKKVLAEYDELNNYYRKLAGLPPYGTPESEFVYLPMSLQIEYNVAANVPVHQLMETIQNKLIVTPEYQIMLDQHPDKEYLKFIGVYKVPIVISRRGKDFQLIRYVPNDRSGINPYLLKLFGIVYNEYRDYIMHAIYNKEMEGLVVGYREFMQMIIVCLVLMQLCPRSIESCINHRYLDDRIIQIVLDMYSIPKEAVISNTVRRRLVIALNKMIQRKATNQVFYDILNVLQYDDTKLYKLMLVKQQTFFQDNSEYASRQDVNEFENVGNDGETNVTEYSVLDVANHICPSYSDLPKFVVDWCEPYGNQTWDESDPLTPGINMRVISAEGHYDRNGIPIPWVYTLERIEYPDITVSYDTSGKALPMSAENELLIEKGGRLIWSAGRPLSIPRVRHRPRHSPPLKPATTANMPDENGIYFQAIDIREKDPYTAINNAARKYSYGEITSGDPRWWEDEEIYRLIKQKEYGMAETKYIMVESIIDQTQMMFETVYFMRMILDNKLSTDQFLFTIPDVFGSNLVSLFDAILFILAVMCERYSLTGEIVTTASGLIAIAGFNFDIDMTALEEFLRQSHYVDRDRLLENIRDISMRDISDVNRLFNEMMIPLRDWLTIEMATSDDLEKFREYEKLYRALFCYDAVRKVFTEGFESPENIIMDQLEISKEDYYAYKAFYPHNPDGTTTFIEEEPYKTESGYFPFLSDDNEKPTSLLAGKYKVYLYDILNSPDLRYQKNLITGELEKNPLFWDIDNNPNPDIFGPGGLLDQIDNLGANDSKLDLQNAYFRIGTNTADGRFYPANMPLPMSIKSKYRKILRAKVEMDYYGYAEAPRTYKDYLRRKSSLFYGLFAEYEEMVKINEENKTNDVFLNKLMSVVKSIEEAVMFRLKYFDRFVGGDEWFFDPLIALIKYFKSYMVDFARTATSFIIKDKFDAGGNSNMLKLFDETSKFVIGMHGLHEKGFGLYDTKVYTKHKPFMPDCLPMTDRVKFWKNGVLEQEHWFTGENETGQYVIDPSYPPKE